MENPTVENASLVEVEPESTPVEVPQEATPAIPDHDGFKRVRELALKQLNRFMSCEAKVLKGDDSEAIHDMRVASRRLQQVLDLLYPKPRAQEIRQLRRKIQRSRQAIGDVRNCDVLLEFVKRSLARKRSARREAWLAVQQFLTERRAETFHRTLHKLGKINPTGFYVDLKHLLHPAKSHDHSPEHHAHEGEATRTSFVQELARALESTWQRFEEQVEASHRDSRPEVVHEARIAAKRLRYLVEVIHEFDAPGAADVLAWLREIQKHLGDWHDLDVLEQMMIEMLAQPNFLRDRLQLAMEVEKLILRNRKNKTELEAKYSEMSPASTEMLRLKEWVAYFVASPSTVLTTG